MSEGKEPMQTNKYVMYIIVNSDLKMEKGKIASQVGHVVGVITEEIIRNSYELIMTTHESIIDYGHYRKWVDQERYTKVVLKASEGELLHLINTQTKSTKCRYILDEVGKSDNSPKSLTVVGFFPRNDLDEMMSTFKLL